MGELYARGPLWIPELRQPHPRESSKQIRPGEEWGRVRGTTANVAEEPQLTHVLIEIEGRRRITSVLMAPLSALGFHFGGLDCYPLFGGY